MNAFTYRVDENLTALDVDDPFAQALADTHDDWPTIGSYTFYGLLVVGVATNPTDSPTVTRDRLAEWMKHMRGESK